MKNSRIMKNKLLTELNEFMKQYGITEIEFDKHSVRISTNKKAKEILKQPKTKEKANGKA